MDPYSPRISAEVHTGEEQVMIHLARSLRVAMGRDQVGYGEIYVVSSSGGVIRLASRSEIGRGFEGEIRVRPARRGTLAEYFVLRLPGDESLHSRVLRLDRQIADALHGIDPQAEVRMYAEQPEQRNREPRACRRCRSADRPSAAPGRPAGAGSTPRAAPAAGSPRRRRA